MIATSPSFRKVLLLNGLKRNCFVRLMASETASTAEMGCMVVLSAEATAYYRITQFLSVKFRCLQRNRSPTVKRRECPLTHHPVPLLFVANSPPRFFIQRIKIQRQQQVKRDVGRLKILRVRVRNVVNKRSQRRRS